MLDMLSPSMCSLPGSGGTEEVAGNLLFIKAAMSQRLPAAECSDLLFGLGAECRKLDLTSCINHYLSAQELRCVAL